MVAVDVMVEDDTLSPAPIAGVVVGVFSYPALVLQAIAVTDSLGAAAFLLAGIPSPGTTYEVRFFKLGVVFGNPFRVQVIEPLGAGETNVFDVSGTLVDKGVATDPRLCRCVGRFMGIKNQPIADALVRLVSKAEFPTPKVVDTNFILPSAFELRTDPDGYVVVDLLRGGEYYAILAGEDEEPQAFRVPDRTNAVLSDLLHPYPVSLDWDDTLAPGDALTLAVGETVLLPFTLSLSDYLVLEDEFIPWVSFAASDEAKIAFRLSESGLELGGISSGVVTITPSIKGGLLPSRLPTPTFGGAPALTVTITG